MHTNGESSRTVLVPCRNTESGCTDRFSYGEISIHEKECNFSTCACPYPGCDHTGAYNKMLEHIFVTHSYSRKFLRFSFGDSIDVQMNINDKTLLLRERRARVYVAVQCFREPRGVYVTVRGFAKSATESGNFSYRLSYSVNGHVLLTYESPEVKRLIEVSSERPEESLMFIPNSLLSNGESLKMKLCIEKKV